MNAPTIYRMVETSKEIAKRNGLELVITSDSFIIKRGESHNVIDSFSTIIETHSFLRGWESSRSES